MKKEAKENAEKGVDNSIPEGFGMPQKDAETFTKVVLKSKKRKLADISGGNKEVVDENSKKQKIEEDPNQISSKWLNRN